MKTDTGQKIFEFIKEKGQVPPKEIISFVDFSAQAVFKQLKKLQTRGLIAKTGKPPRVYYHLLMKNKETIEQEAIVWATATENAAEQLNRAVFCSTYDVFQARQNRLPKELESVIQDNQLSHLLSAIVGEIGNNSFDHNFGNWPDIPGIYFKIDTHEKIICLADRGNGVFYTLKKVRPEISNDLGALQVAFTEVVSGRATEHRGNGLKFVRRAAEECNLKIKFYSGDAVCQIDSDKITFSPSKKLVRGTVAIIEF